MVERVSLSLPQDLEEIDFKMPMVFLTLEDWMLVCSKKLSFGSKVTPRILGWRLVGIWILLMVRVGETFSSEVSYCIRLLRLYQIAQSKVCTNVVYITDASTQHP